ncbi:MAG: bifunctional riboflavin kinase/FAD synthetase [Rhizobiaceae bacterium]|nr:bifunctional riboflavin kinase/FAD synthetase [Rhizobiaceae bacterium]
MAGSLIRRITPPAPLPDDLRQGVVAVGNFDGVHRGHRAVLQTALDEAKRRAAPALVLTFEPHPRRLFRPHEPHFVLTPPPMRARLLGELGFDGVVEYPFTRDFSALSADGFVTDILEHLLGLSHVVAGFDFHFGKNRQGGPAFLIESGKQNGFGVTLVDAYRDENAEVISSSRIRRLLEQGEVSEAAGLLGYRYTVEAPIIGGQKLGRTLGFPTANMQLHPDIALRHGIYAVRFRRADGSLHDGVASCGRRPTVTDSGAPLLETYIFDFSDDLYGEECQVHFFGFLRAEEKFDGLDALIAQMRRDEEEARALLSGCRPLSPFDLRISFHSQTTREAPAPAQ